MKEQQTRHFLPPGDAYKLTRWIDDHGAEAGTMTLDELADAAFKATGINATKSNIKRICKVNGFPYLHARPRIVDPSRLSSSKKTRFLAATVRRLSLQIEELYRQCGAQVPPNLAINADGLKRLSLGLNGDTKETLFP